ncbi:MAG: hypothetical protein HFI45_10450 [Lachnospiraceae bacterium]|nr:hypothetical protein [Lachnospiraceae bacterium]
MSMRGIFCQTTATTNEEYRKELKDRNGWLLFMAIGGAGEAAAAALAESGGTLSIPDYMLGVYCGTGAGIMVAAIVLYIRNLFLLKDEEKLKKSRLENYDERNQEIRNKALLAAVKILLVVCFVTAMVGGIFYPYLIKMLLFVIYVFLFSYLIANAYYKRRM